MTTRDRTVLMVVIVLAVLGAGWVLVVSPERKQADKIAAEVATAKSQLSTAEGELSDARAAQTQYASAYSSIVNLGKAVPAEEEVPSLIYQLSQATHQQHVEFASIAVPSVSAAATTAATAAAAAGAFSQMPFTFVFNGDFFALEHLFNKLTQFTQRNANGELQVRGRLLTVQSLKLAPAVEPGAATGKTKSTPTLSGTITATAYRLPAGQALTGGATATSPAGASTPAATSGTSSPTAPAIARVTP